MAKILLGVTGSVAASRTHDLHDALQAEGHQLRIAATESSLYFFDAESFANLEPASDSNLPRQALFRDRDEWPGMRYQRGDSVLHIELRRWADILVVAPLDANSLAKFALGISDNLLSCVYRAWEPDKPIVLAPAMNTRMWDHPVTLRHLRQIVADHSDGPIIPDFSLDNLPKFSASHPSRLILIPPQSKALACGDIGMGAMAEVATISAIVQSWIGQPES